MSGQLLGGNNLASELEPLLAELLNAGSSLELEITESAVMENPDAAINQLQELRRAGIKIALDDFGQGYLFCRPVPAEKLESCLLVNGQIK